MKLIDSLTRFYFASLITSSILNSCSVPDKFDSNMICVSEKGYGVLVTKIIQHDKPEVPTNGILDNIYVKPSIPGEYDSRTSLRKSKQIPQSKLPNYITFEYQFMELSDCSSSRESKTAKLIFLKDYSPLEIGDIRELSQEKADFYLKKTGGDIATLASISTKENTKEEVLEQYEKELKTSKTYKVKYGCKTWTAIDSLKFTKTIDLKPYKKAKEIKRFGKRYKNSADSYYGTSITYQFYDEGEIKLSLENYTSNPWK